MEPEEWPSILTAAKMKGNFHVAKKKKELLAQTTWPHPHPHIRDTAL